MAPAAGRCLLCGKERAWCFKIFAGRYSGDEVACVGCLRDVAITGTSVTKAGFTFSFERKVSEWKQGEPQHEVQYVVVNRQEWGRSTTRIPVSLFDSFVSDAAVRHAREAALGLDDLFDDIDDLVKR